MVGAFVTPMTLEELEEEKDALHLELRELLLKRSENQLAWTQDGLPTSKTDRDTLNMEIDETKRDLTEVENHLREAKRQGRMRFSECLASICLREGHGNYVDEAKVATGFEP